MGARPCFTSCFGIPLQTSVIIVGVIELFITIIATVLNIVKYAKYLDPDGDECEGKDVCIGPLIKYSVFDAFFGVLCALFSHCWGLHSEPMPPRYLDDCHGVHQP